MEVGVTSCHLRNAFIFMVVLLAVISVIFIQITPVNRPAIFLQQWASLFMPGRNTSPNTCDPVLKNAPCNQHKLVSDEPGIRSFNSSKEVHKFMMRCSPHAPKLISFLDPVGENITSDQEDLLVPNIVHYVWFEGGAKFTFLCYLSFLGVHRYIKPDFIYLHGEKEPIGYWWNQTLLTVANVYFVYRMRPTHILGKKISRVEHSADIARYDIIYDYGGIYLDTDVLVVKSFRPLLKFDLTIGRESPTGLGNGIIVGRRGAPFFRIWRETYRTFNPREWGQHSVTMTGTLQKIFPALIHVEEGTLISPNYKNRKQLFQKGYDWSKNYAVHIWKKAGKIPTDPKGIRQLDNLLGELMRYIYFGSKELL